MTNRHAPDFPSDYPKRSSGAFSKDLRRKVMVVDDDPTILVGVAAYLEANGYLTIEHVRLEDSVPPRTGKRGAMDRPHSKCAHR